VIAVRLTKSPHDSKFMIALVKDALTSGMHINGAEAKFIGVWRQINDIMR
jgi:hypothetical protein